MDTCGATRLLLPSFVVGVSVSSMTGSDLFGWLAAAFTVAVLVVVRRIRGNRSSCAIKPTAGSPDVVVAPSEPESARTSIR